MYELSPVNSHRVFHHQCPLAFKPLDKDWITPPLGFLVLQLTDGTPWDFSAYITAWTNPCNKHLSR